MYVSNPDANPNVPSKDILITKNDYIVSAPNETLRFREYFKGFWNTYAGLCCRHCGLIKIHCVFWWYVRTETVYNL